MEKGIFMALVTGQNDAQKLPVFIRYHVSLQDCQSFEVLISLIVLPTSTRKCPKPQAKPCFISNRDMQQVVMKHSLAPDVQPVCLLLRSVA